MTDIGQMTLKQLEDAIHSCTNCPLHQGRTQAVPGEGPSSADIMFIGEGPGFHEDRQGRPFVGAAGKFLEELLASIGLTREQVYIANVIVTLGRFSMYRYFPGASISKIHGQPKRVGNVLVVPMFHPAAALHQPKWRPLVEADFKKLPNFIAEAEGFGDEVPPPQAQQLSLF